MANRAPTVEHDDDEDTLFVKDGTPVKFCFHKSVTQGRGQIARDVERHGGEIVRDERLANVLLVDEQEDLAFIRRRYYSSTELYRLSLYVESRGFVQQCIRSGTYFHIGPVKQGMPGRVPGGRRRVPFTEEDRDHLAYYLATRCPTRDGRTGNNAYKDLERLGRTDDSSWEWARRHTFHSWREHYKMNPIMMDARIDYYLQQLKDVGHHFGHDPRRRNHWNLRQEEEESDSNDEGEEQQQGIEGEERERRQQVRPAAAKARRARDSFACHEQDLVTSDEGERDGIQEEEEEIAVQDLHRVKRHLVHAQQQRDVEGTQAKRARVTEASSNERRVLGVETGRGEGSPVRERDSDHEESEDIEGSDLFGDRAYEDESHFDAQDIDLPVPLSPRASPIPGQEGPPLSTQATLIASPIPAEKEPTRVVELQAPTPQPTVLPSSQQTMVMTQERAIVQRVRVRGASAQPGPSVPKKTRTRGEVAAVEGPYRNTRARSRSHSIDPQLPQQREDQGSKQKGKGKAKEEALVSIEEDVHVEEEPREMYAEEVGEPVAVSNGFSTRETFEDEIAVEGLLKASVGSGINNDGGSEESLVVLGEDDEDSDGKGDIMTELPRFQEIEIGSDPTDSDDAETHGSLVRGVVREGSVGGGDAESDRGQGQDANQDQDEEDSDSDSADADRIERMASGSLHVALAPMLPQPRVTRPMTTTQTQPQVSPRQTRSGSQARTRGTPSVFPSPGTRARAVVDRFQEEEKRIPYAPPVGSRAARVVRGKRTRG